MNKSAATEIPLSPEEAYLTSKLLGKGLFGLTQMLHQKRKYSPPIENLPSIEEDEDDVLSIPIPAQHLKGKTAAEQDNTVLAQLKQKIAESDYNSSDTMMSRLFKSHSNPLQAVLGTQQGFADARKAYYLAQKAQIAADIQQAQKEYIDLLSKIKTGQENETPCVDAFCNGIAYNILNQKTAEDQPPEIEEGSLKRVLGNTLGLFKKPIQPVIDTAASGLLNTASASAYLTYLLRKKMKESPDSYLSGGEDLPTRVSLNPYEHTL